MLSCLSGHLKITSLAARVEASMFSPGMTVVSSCYSSTGTPVNSLLGTECVLTSVLHLGW